MEGMIFLILDPKQQVRNQGLIAQKVTDGKYLCQFQAPTVFAQVIPVEEIQKWQLFTDMDQAKTFIDTIQQQQQPPPEPEPPVEGEVVVERDPDAAQPDPESDPETTH